MPLYDYRCGDCEYENTIQLKMFDPPPQCPNCGSKKFTKQIVPFQTSGLSQKSAIKKSSKSQKLKSHNHATKTHSHCTQGSKKDTHSHGCSHNHSKNDHTHSCSSSNIDKLIAKHDKQAKPLKVNSPITN